MTVGRLRLVEESADGPASQDAAEVWRITERGVEVAQSGADMWLTFAGRSLRRAREGGPRRWGLVTECWAFVVSLDHLRDCAVMASNVATVAGVSDDLAAALDTFDWAVPDVADLRDVLDHHDDDYVRGTGKLQQPRRPPRQRVVDEALASGWAVQCGFRDPIEARQPWIGVGPSAGDPSAGHLPPSRRPRQRVRGGPPTSSRPLRCGLRTRCGADGRPVERDPATLSRPSCRGPVRARA